MLDKVKDLNVPVLNSPIGDVYYSTEAKNKAMSIQLDMANYMTFVKNNLAVDIAPINLAILNKNDYEKLGLSFPYGYPFVRGVPEVAFLPADNNGIIATETRKLLEKTDTALIKQIQILGFDKDNAINRSVDLIAFHELGHLISEKLTIQPKIKDVFWLKEFVPSYIAYVYLHKNDSTSAQLWLLSSKSVVASWQPQNTDLLEMEKFRNDPKTYSWFQSQLIIRADKLVKTNKINLIKLLQSQTTEQDMEDRINELLQDGK